MPFFIVLVILTAPFALIFSLLRLPFARRRTENLKHVITKDWIVRKKYVYIGYHADSPIAQYIEREILPKYKAHIIYDKWSDKGNEWKKSEPDTYRRVTTIWQDIAGDFDGDPICIVGVIAPGWNQITEENLDVYYFNYPEYESANLKGKELSLDDIKKKIDADIKAGLNNWKNRQIEVADDTEEVMGYLGATMPKRIYEAHKHSTNHRAEIEASKICGCFYCLQTFAPSQIKEWIKNDAEEFAMCPSCGIDSVIGDASGIAITDDFLKEMNKYWFDGDALTVSK